MTHTNTARAAVMFICPHCDRSVASLLTFPVQMLPSVGRCMQLLRGKCKDADTSICVFVCVQCWTLYLRLWSLTWVSHRNPVVELIVVGHSVKLAAQHLSKGRLLVLAGLCVTSPVALPFSGAILASKFWSMENSGTVWMQQVVGLISGHH